MSTSSLEERGCGGGSQTLVLFFCKPSERADSCTDDYVTRGVTLGGSSSAIATAVLLQSDPRAAALSSLSMSLFGIITLALTSVPAIVKAVDSLVGL